MLKLHAQLQALVAVKPGFLAASTEALEAVTCTSTLSYKAFLLHFNGL